MKSIILSLFVIILLSNCSENDNLENNTTEIWKGVYYNAISEEYEHDPQYNYTLLIDDLNNVKITLPTEVVDNKILAIEILDNSKMEITWEVNSQTHIVLTDYSYNQQNELVISKFTYTDAHIPFPNNLSSGKFIREINTNK